MNRLAALWRRRRSLGTVAGDLRTGWRPVRLVGWWVAQQAVILPYFTIMAHRSVAAAATRHALSLVRLEKRLGLFVEPRLVGPARAGWLDWLYLWPHAVLLVGCLPLVLWRRPGYAAFFVLRCWWAMSLGSVAYILFPTAPPRLLPALRLGGGWFRFPDGLGRLTGGAPSFDLYAAFPSYHVAFAVIVLGAALACRPGWAARLLGCAYVVCISLVVLLSANHYLADVLGGLALGAASGWLAGLSVRAAAWARAVGQGRSWAGLAAARAA